MDPKKIKIEFTDIFEGVYKPGDELRGEVRFHLTQPVKVLRKIVGLVVRDDGLCVEKIKTKIEHVVYSSKVQYCDAKLDLWEGDYLASDQYAMPFRYTIPSNCMPSFEGQHGNITYKVIIKTDPIWRSKKQCERSFTVLPCFDLTKNRRFANPISKSECQNTGVALFRCGNVAIECKLSKSGYAIGEDILVECSVDNGSTKPVQQAKAELIQHAKFIAYKGGSGTATFLNMKKTTQNEMKEQDVSVSSSVKDALIMPKTKQDFIIKLPVVPTVPSFDKCKIIRVEHYVKIKIKTDALMNNSLVIKIPITVGTISIWPTETPSQPSHPSAPSSENAERQYETIPIPPSTSTIPSTPFSPVHSNSTDQPNIGWSQIVMNADFPPTYDEATRE